MTGTARERGLALVCSGYPGTCLVRNKRQQSSVSVERGLPRAAALLPMWDFGGQGQSTSGTMKVMQGSFFVGQGQGEAVGAGRFRRGPLRCSESQYRMTFPGHHSKVAGAAACNVQWQENQNTEPCEFWCDLYGRRLCRKSGEIRQMCGNPEMKAASSSLFSELLGAWLAGPRFVLQRQLTHFISFHIWRKPC